LIPILSSLTAASLPVLSTLYRIGGILALKIFVYFYFLTKGDFDAPGKRYMENENFIFY